MKLFFFTIFVILMLFAGDQGFCLDAVDVARLKKVGISDETLNVIIREKAIETCLVSVDEILTLKQSGVRDQTIRSMIEEGSFIKDSVPMVYGRNIKSMRDIMIEDLIELKNAGVNDEMLWMTIMFGSKIGADKELEKAWEMLRNMDIVVDKRHRQNGDK